VSFVVSSYNVLATAHIKPRFYPHVAPERLQPQWRLSALADAVERLAAHVLCLQEVEEDSFAALGERLRKAGYAGEYLKKCGARPDGCATFFDRSLFTLADMRQLAYDDATGDRPASGHVALLLRLRHGARTIGIANTHIKWDSPTALPDQRFGLCQAHQLIAEMADSCDAWIACGDFNKTSENEILEAFRTAGFADAFAAQPDAFTSNANGVAKRIDYLLHRGPLTAISRPLPTIDSTTPLPSLEQPSDHLPISATFEWR
jgi:protein angel